jgi:hypothetical protein
VSVGLNSIVYMTTHQQDSSHPQQSQLSPQERTGLGLMMEEMEEAAPAGMLRMVLSVVLWLDQSGGTIAKGIDLTDVK